MLRCASRLHSWPDYIKICCCGSERSFRSADKNKSRLAQLQMSLPDLIEKSTLTEKACCDILAGKTVSGIDATASLSKALDTSMDYLVGNSDYSCAIASEDEQDIILRYRQLSKKGKRIFWGMMENMEEENRIVYLTGEPLGCYVSRRTLL